MIAERRGHRGRHLSRLEIAHPGTELRVEARIVFLDPADIAAAMAADGVARLALGDILELHPAGQLGAHARDLSARRRAIGGVRQAWHRHEAHVSHGGALEIVRVFRHVRADFSIADRRRIGDRVGPDRQRRDRRGIVLIFVDPPEFGVRDVDVGREVLCQLDAGNLVAIHRFDLHEQLAIRRRSQELLPFANIELTVRLKLGIPHHFGRRRCRCNLADFVVADANTQTTVFLLQ